MRTASEAADEKRSQINAHQRTRYAQMPKEKKDAILQRRRQIYAEKKSQKIKDIKYARSEPQTTEIDSVDVRGCQVPIIDKLHSINPQRENVLPKKRQAYADKKSKERIEKDGLQTRIVKRKWDAAQENKNMLKKRPQSHVADKNKARTGSSSAHPPEILQSTMESDLHSLGIKMHTCLSKTFHPQSYANKGIVINDHAAEQAIGRRNERKTLRTSDRNKNPINFYSSFDIGSPSTITDDTVHLKKQSTLPAPDFPQCLMCCMKHIRSITYLEAEHPLATTLTSMSADIYQETRSKKRKRSASNKVLSSAKKDSRDVSCREYYCYKLQIRPNDRSILLRAGRLLQQYAVDMYVKLETSRLDYFRQNQKEIRGEVYQGIKDSVAMGETRALKVGKRIVLPSSFTGGPRDMHARYMDAMTLVQKFGKPDILLTMTCNPNWPEIKSELLQGEESHNRPDLCARVFKAKVELMKEDLIKKQILGPIVAYTYVIEYQKRGLPHVHFALIFMRNAKLISPDLYDRLVCAELPDKEINPHLYNMVVKHMMHGPCGVLNPQNVCMQRDGHCKNHYPKKFCPTTTQRDDSYPIYRRRDDGKQVRVRKHILDNRWVVPYNPYLLAKYDCHINVEICSSFKIVKYLYKYIYKGHDQISFNIGENEESTFIDEIQRFQSARWISAAEAMWRIYRFKLNEMHPAVYSLRLHLEGIWSTYFGLLLPSSLPLYKLCFH